MRLKRHGGKGIQPESWSVYHTLEIGYFRLYIYRSIIHRARLRSIVFSSSFNPITNKDKKLSIEGECFGKKNTI